MMEQNIQGVQPIIRIIAQSLGSHFQQLTAIQQAMYRQTVDVISGTIPFTKVRTLIARSRIQCYI